MKKRFLSLLLVLAMVLSMAPVGVFAEDIQAEAEPVAQDSDVYCYVDATAEYKGEDGEDPYVDVQVKYHLGGAYETGLLVAAAYEGEQMVASTSQPVLPSGSEAELGLADVPENCRIQVFLLNGSTLEPLCGNVCLDVGGDGYVYDAGEQGEVKWTLEGDTLSIESKTDAPAVLLPSEGDTRDYGWSRYADQIRSVRLTNISSIAKGAFASYQFLSQVSFDDCPVEIGDMAFYGCIRLNTVECDSSIVSVGQRAFDGCTSLSQEFVFTGLKELGDGAFANSGVYGVDLSGCTALTNIPSSAFENCWYLTVALPDNVTIDTRAFAGARIYGINLEKAKGINEYAFVDAVIMNGLTVNHLAPYAFAGAQLGIVTVGEDVTEIPEGAFKASRIEEIRFSDSVTTICQEAFAEGDVNRMCVTGNLKTVENNAFREGNLNYLYDATENWDDLNVGEEGNGIFQKAWKDMCERNHPQNDADLADTLEAEEEPPEEVAETPKEELPEEPKETPEELPEGPAEQEDPEKNTQEKPEEEEPDDLTAEEAADQGYYMAPGGAQMGEEANWEDMASYEGTDKVSRGIHTVTFTGLIPQNWYTMIVSTQPRAVDGECLQFIDQSWCDDSGTLTFTYIPRTDAKAIVQLYGPDKLTLEPDRDYLMLHPGDMGSVAMYSNYENAKIIWDNPEALPDDDGEPVLYVRANTEDGSSWEIEAAPSHAEETNSYYVIFRGEGGGQSATVKIRVDVVPNAMVVDGVSLGETTVTRNVYDEDATELPIFLQMTKEAENQVVQQSMLNADEEETENSNLYIEDVRFSKDTPADVRDFFTVEAKDDRTLLLRTNPEKVKTASDVRSLKSSYRGITFDVKIKGQEEPLSTQAMTLTVQKVLPKIRANAVTLNPYYAAESGITFTGGEVDRIVGEVNCGNTAIAYEFHQDGTLDAEDGETQETVYGYDEFYVDYAKGVKSASLNIRTQVKVWGCLVPVDVTIPVRLDVKAPALKLETNIWTIPSVGLQSTEIRFVSATKGVDLNLMYFVEEAAEVCDRKGNPVEGYSADVGNGYLSIRTDAMLRPAGRQDLKVRFRVCPYGEHVDYEKDGMMLELPISVINQDPKVKLSTSNLSINIDTDQEAYLVATVTGLGDAEFPNWNYTVTGGGLKDAKEYFIVHQPDEDSYLGDGQYLLRILPLFNHNAEDFTDAAFQRVANGTYTISIGLGTKPSTRLTVKLTNKTPTIRLTASGALNTDNVNSFVTVNAAVTNGRGLDVLGYTVTAADKTDKTEEFEFGYDESLNKWVIRAASGKASAAGQYTLSVDYGSEYITDAEGPLVLTKASTVFKVERAKRTLNVTGKLDSFNMDTWVRVVPSYVRRNEAGETLCPDVTLKDAKGVEMKECYDWHTDDEGTIYIRPLVKGGRMLPAGRYTVTLTYREEVFGEAFTITGAVQVTQPRLKLTAYGSLDSFREENSVLLEHNFAAFEVVEDGDYTGEVCTGPVVTIENTNRRAEKKTLTWGEDFTVQYNGSTVELRTVEGSVIPAGTYKVTLNFGQWNGKPVTLSTNIRVTQTPVKVKLDKTSLTLHPNVTMEPVSIRVSADRDDPATVWKLELCDRRGTPVGTNADLIKYAVEQTVEETDTGESYAYGKVEVVGTGKIPASDTTLYLKLTPDTRVPGNYQLLAVRVLGQKSIDRLAKLNLTTRQTLDPSYEFNHVMLTGALKGFDAGDVTVKTTLQVSTDNGRTYVDVSDGTYVYTDYERGSQTLYMDIGMAYILSGAKYRVQVDCYGDRTCEKRIATAVTNLRTAYGANRFTVEKAPTLYKADPWAEMDLKLNAKDPMQKIDHITLKGSSDFVIYGNGTDWTLRYDGDNPARLRTTALTLQIFLKGNDTARPNATTSVRVTVK